MRACVYPLLVSVCPSACLCLIFRQWKLLLSVLLYLLVLLLLSLLLLLSRRCRCCASSARARPYLTSSLPNPGAPNSSLRPSCADTSPYVHIDPQSGLGHSAKDLRRVNLSFSGWWGLLVCLFACLARPLACLLGYLPRHLLDSMVFTRSFLKIPLFL